MTTFTRLNSKRLMIKAQSKASSILSDQFLTKFRIQSREMLLNIHGRKRPSSGPVSRRMDNEVPLGSEAREEIKLDIFHRFRHFYLLHLFLVLICPMVQ